MYMYHIFIIHLSVEGCLCYFLFVAIVNITAMNMAEEVSAEIYAESFGHMPRSSKKAVLDHRFRFCFLRFFTLISVVTE